MTLFASLFVILFLADAQLSLVDELLSLASASNLAEMRASLADFVYLLALPMYLFLGFDKRLPKRVFVPLTAYVFFCPLTTWFFPSLSGVKGVGVILALTQFLLVFLPIHYIRKRGGETLFISEEMLGARSAGKRAYLVFWGANLIVLPITIAVFALANFNSYLETSTAGFMHLRPGGLYMTEKVYRKDHKTIRLIAMIHVGEKGYYDGLVSSIASGKTLVLAEGVTDRDKRLKTRFGYGKVAGLLGLTSQETMRLKGRFLPEGEVLAADSGEVAGNTPDIVRGDVDLSTFSPVTLHFLEVLGKYLGADTSSARQMMAFYRWTEKNVTPEMYQTIMSDILYGRNKVVIGHLDRALARYDTVVIPWGALHMPEIEEDVVQKGFVLQGARDRESIDIPKLIAHSL